MAKSPQYRKRPKRAPVVPISIIGPGPGDCRVVDAQGRTEVSINNSDLHNCKARIHDLVAGSGLGSSHGDTTLIRDGTTTRFFGMVNVGPISGSSSGNNKFAKAIDLDAGDEQGNPFLAVPFGSVCPSGSFRDSGAQVAAELRKRFSQKDRPIPVALSMQLDARVAKGTCANCNVLNRPTLLVYSHDAKYAYSWLSEPIFLGPKKAGPSYWILEKSAPRIWKLVLKRGPTVVATYALKTKDKKDATFPLQLQRSGRGGRECTKWPATVTIAPAP